MTEEQPPQRAPTIGPGSELWKRLPSAALPRGRKPCACGPRPATSPLDLIVLTGGPGAGKTAVLEAARVAYCEHVAVVPEAATILFGGGFPRHDTIAGRKAAQRAIYHVQREAERLVEDEHIAHAALCDRGTVDGVAYWPGPPDEYWDAVGSSRTEQLGRYSVVVHLRTPLEGGAYNHSNAVRTEDVEIARAIDERILAAWDGHPNRVVIDPHEDFEHKLHAALEAIKPWIPEHHHISGRAGTTQRGSAT
jgi:predicted ATPase